MTREKARRVAWHGVCLDRTEVLGVREGRKTQKRFVVDGPRVSQPQHIPDDCGGPGLWSFIEWDGSGEPGHHIEEDFEVIRDRMIVVCPWGRAGDRLYVREAFAPTNTEQPLDRYVSPGYRQHVKFAFAADHPVGHRALQASTGYELKWRPPQSMPRWASRTTLEILSVRVQRLQEISEADVLAEGCTHLAYRCAAEMAPEDPHEYSDRWDLQHCRFPLAQWAANPWVYAVEFKVLA